MIDLAGRARLFEASAPDLIGKAYRVDGWPVEVVSGGPWLVCGARSPGSLDIIAGHRSQDIGELVGLRHASIVGESLPHDEHGARLLIWFLTQPPPRSVHLAPPHRVPFSFIDS